MGVSHSLGFSLSGKVALSMWMGERNIIMSRVNSGAALFCRIVV